MHVSGRRFSFPFVSSLLLPRYMPFLACPSLSSGRTSLVDLFTQESSWPAHFPSAPIGFQNVSRTLSSARRCRDQCQRPRSSTQDRCLNDPARQLHRALCHTHLCTGPVRPSCQGSRCYASSLGSGCGTPSSRAGYGHVGWENRRRMVPPVATDDGLDGVVEAFNCLPLAVPSDSHYRYHNDDKNHLYPLRDDDLVYAYMRICGI